MVKRDLAPPPYNILVISSDQDLVRDLETYLARRPAEIHFGEPGAQTEVIVARPGLAVLAYAPGVPEEARRKPRSSDRFRTVETGDPLAPPEEAYSRLRELLVELGAWENLSVGLVGVPANRHEAVMEHLQATPFRMARVSRREEARDPELLGCADLIFLDAKIGGVDSWAFARELKGQFTGAGAPPIFGVVPAIDVELLSHTREYGIAGFLLRVMIDERMFPRVEGVARQGLSRRNPARTDDRYAPPSARRPPDRIATVISTEEPPEESAPESPPSAVEEVDKEERGAFLLGRTLGKVTLRRILGHGGAGTVYEGWHLTLDVPVAVKVVFADDVSRDPRFAHRFIEEARLAARLDHANTVRVIDFDRHDETGCYYLVMELVRGSSLLELIREGRRFTEDRLLEIADSVVEVLDLAHEHGIVHRDISPGNILITERGGIKLADLGIAKIVSDTRKRRLPGSENLEEGSSSPVLADGMPAPIRTGTGILLGTPHYISPEQAEDAQKADLRSDMYSLGATLFHAATRRPPYLGRTVEELIRAHREEPVPSPRVSNKELSSEFAAILMRLLQKRPEERYASYAALRRSLKECRDEAARRALLGEPRSSRWWRKPGRGKPRKGL